MTTTTTTMLLPPRPSPPHLTSDSSPDLSSRNTAETTTTTATSTTYHYNKQLLRTGAFSDCTIITTCRDPRHHSHSHSHSHSSHSSSLASSPRSPCCCSSWPAHRNVLAPRCDFFRCCFEGGFREARGPCIVDMRDDDPVAVEGLLYYLYTLEYPAEVYRRMLWPFSSGDGDGGSDSGVELGDEDEYEDGRDGRDGKSKGLGLDARVYWGFDLLMHDVADKYGLLGLREMAARSLIGKAALVGGDHEGQDKADQQERHQHQHQHQHKFETTLDGFVALVEDLYPAEEEEEEEGEDDGNDLRRVLRRHVVRSACQGIARHIRDQRISTLLADAPAFAVELVDMLAQRREERRLAQREEEKRNEALKARLTHIPMNEESDCDD